MCIFRVAVPTNLCRPTLQVLFLHYTVMYIAHIVSLQSIAQTDHVTNSIQALYAKILLLPSRSKVSPVVQSSE